MQSHLGQTSIFILFGLILLISIGLFLALYSFSNEIPVEKINENSLKLNARHFLELCFQTVVKDALFEVAKSGGIQDPSGESLLFGNYQLPYYYFERRILLPTLSAIENEIAKEVSDTLDGCLSKLDYEFKSADLDYTTKKVNVEIIAKQVLVSIDYPVTIEVGETLYKIDESYSVIVDSDLYAIHGLSNELLEKIKSDPKNFPLGFLAIQSATKGLEFSYENINDDIAIIIIDKKETDDKSLKFGFAIKMEQ